MATISIDKVTDDFSKITNQLLTDLASAANDSVKEIAQIAGHVAKQATILKDTGVKLEYQLKDTYQNVLTLLQSACAYIDKVDDFFYYVKHAKAQAKIVSESIKLNNYRPLIQTLGQLHRTLNQVQGFYKDFEEACEAASTSSVNAAEEYRCKRNEAEMNKQKWGGAATVVSLGLGVLTLGASLPVSAMLLGAGVATATGTYYIAEYYEKAEELFRDLSQSFNLLYRKIRKVHDTIEDITPRFDNISTLLTDSMANNDDIVTVTDKSVSWFEQPVNQTLQDDSTNDTDQKLALSAEELFTKLSTGQEELVSVKDIMKQARIDLKKVGDSLYATHE